MSKLFKFSLAILGMLGLMRLASAAPETAGQNRPLDARVVRVQVDGVVDLHLRQGSPASLVLSGERRMLEQIRVDQSGDRLIIGSEGHDMRLQRKGGVRAELVLPNLRQVSSESLGTIEIAGFRGEQLEVSLDGAGTMSVKADYRVVKASLGGVGSMKLDGLNSERILLDLQGAGYVTLIGRSKFLKAELGGVGGLDAQQFAADSVDLELSGMGNATVTASRSAVLNLSGMGSVTVYGKPLSRRVSVEGLGKVSWK